MQVAESRFLTHGKGIQAIERFTSHVVLRLNTRIYIFKCFPHALGRPVARLPTFFYRMASHLQKNRTPLATPPSCLRTLKGFISNFRILSVRSSLYLISGGQRSRGSVRSNMRIIPLTFQLGSLFSLTHGRKVSLCAGRPGIKEQLLSH